VISYAGRRRPVKETQTMPRKGRTNEEIIHALHQVEGGERVAEVCRRLVVSEQTFYRWETVQRARPAGAARAPVAAPRRRQIEAGRRRSHARSAHPAGDCPTKDLSPRARCRLAEWVHRGIPLEPTPGREGDSCAQWYAAVSIHPGSPGRVAAAITGARRRARALRLPALDGAVETRRAGG
jgi:hypothetical protein